MNNKVIFSIKPEWVYKILLQQKLWEVRKTKPQLQLPFSCYIYCTKDNKFDISWGPFGVTPDNDGDPIKGTVCASFLCDDIYTITWDDYNHCYDIDDDTLKETCLTQQQLYDYGKGKTLYAFHIKCLTEFVPGYCIDDFYQSTMGDGKSYFEVKNLTRPPQSWGYVAGHIFK